MRAEDLPPKFPNNASENLYLSLSRQKRWHCKPLGKGPGCEHEIGVDNEPLGTIQKLRGGQQGWKGKLPSGKAFTANSQNHALVVALELSGYEPPEQSPARPEARFREATQTRQIDSKGRLTLGGGYANRIVLVEEREDEIRVRFARVIPEREAWLYENPEALGSVRRGLAQARDGAFAKEAPNLDAAAKLADEIEDD